MGGFAARRPPDAARKTRRTVPPPRATPSRASGAGDPGRRKIPRYPMSENGRSRQDAAPRSRSARRSSSDAARSPPGSDRAATLHPPAKQGRWTGAHIMDRPASAALGKPAIISLSAAISSGPGKRRNAVKPFRGGHGRGASSARATTTRSKRRPAASRCVGGGHETLWWPSSAEMRSIIPRARSSGECAVGFAGSNSMTISSPATCGRHRRSRLRFRQAGAGAGSDGSIGPPWSSHCAARARLRRRRRGQSEVFAAPFCLGKNVADDRRTGGGRTRRCGRMSEPSHGLAIRRSRTRLAGQQCPWAFFLPAQRRRTWLSEG